jgi:tetratricopeptide (TPR) repeat protein
MHAMADGSGHSGVRNVVSGGVPGAVVQAGTVHGGVHVHQPAGTTNVVPRQEPAPPAWFVGRDEELLLLDRVRARQHDRFGLVLITGPAGVGKSALAAKWAAQASGWFPDGHLYAELGSDDPTGPPHPGEVLSGFLRALGVPYDHVPSRVAEQGSLFRSTTAGKDLLLMLDNAVSAAQVRQLLPGGTGCMVVVTARSRLGGLVSDGAEILTLEPLPPLAATAMLRTTVGDHRVDEDSAAAADLVRLCAGLPIALAVTAARLVAHPRWPIRRVVAELARERDPLAVMSTSDGLSVGPMFDLSYRTLSKTAARCYRALGVHPGRRPGTAVIAAALGIPPQQASRGLEELVEANLADDAPDSRYQMHDLIMLHAQQHARSDPGGGTLAGRVAEWYLAGTRAADLLLTPYRRRPPDQFTYLSPTAVTFGDRDEALDWLERERTNLVAVVVATADLAPEVAWRIAYGMWPLFHYRRHHHDRLTVDRVAVDCARRVGNRDFEARMLRRLAFAHFDLAQWAEADRHFQTSLGLCQDLDDRHGVAAALEGLGMVALARRHFTLAAELFGRQLTICEALGEHRRAALATINLGVVKNASGRPTQAVRQLLRAGAMLAALGEPDPSNAARARIELGKALTNAGSHAAATRELHQALRDMRRLGSPRGEAQAHQALAVLAIATAEYGEARTHLDQALTLYERLGDPDAAEAGRLAELIPPADAHLHRMA